MDKSELLKLAERVEALSGRSRVANALIWKACKSDEYHEWEYSSRVMLHKGLSEDQKKGEMKERAKVSAPNFTGSLDAAMKLVPKRLAGQILININGTTQAHIYSSGNGVAGRGDAPTPALALCAAALRALAKEDS